MSDASTELAEIDNAKRGQWMPASLGERWSAREDSLLTRANRIAAEAVEAVLSEDIKRAQKRLEEATAERNRRVRER